MVRKLSLSLYLLKLTELMKLGFNWSGCITDMFVGLALKILAWWIWKMVFFSWKRGFLGCFGIFQSLWLKHSFTLLSTGTQMWCVSFWCILRWYFLSVSLFFFFPSHPHWCSPHSFVIFVRVSCVLCFVACDIGVQMCGTAADIGVWHWHCVLPSVGRTNQLNDDPRFPSFTCAK